MSSEFIKYEVKDQIAIITIDRPKKRNAINVEMAATLVECWQEFDRSDARVAILTSSEDNVFSAGADLMNPPADAWQAIPEVGFHTDKPIIAAVSGKAIGMAVILVAMCDFCVMTEDASLIYPEAKLGFSMGLISTLVQRMPPKIAMEIMLLGDPFSAQRAFEVGFANRVVPKGEHLNEAMKMASTMRENAPLVVSMLKRMTLDAMGKTPIQEYFDVVQKTNKVQKSEDAANALKAFKEKTPKPAFIGK